MSCQAVRIHPHLSDCSRRLCTPTDGALVPPSFVSSAVAPPALGPAVSFGPRSSTSGASALRSAAPSRGTAASGAWGAPLDQPAISHGSPPLIAPASGVADAPLYRISLRPAPQHPAQPHMPAGVPLLSAAAAGVATTAQTPPTSPFAAPVSTEGGPPAAKAHEVASFPGPASTGGIMGAVPLKASSGGSEGLLARSSLSSLRSSHTAAGACSGSQWQVLYFSRRNVLLPYLHFSIILILTDLPFIHSPPPVNMLEIERRIFHFEALLEFAVPVLRRAGALQGSAIGISS